MPTDINISLGGFFFVKTIAGLQPGNVTLTTIK